MKKVVRSHLLPSGNTQFKEVGKPVLAPSSRQIIDDALTLLWVEIGHLKARQQAGQKLTKEDLRSLLDLSDTAARLAKEQREQDKGFKPEDMSDEEYRDELKAAYEAMEEKIKKSKEGQE